MNKKEYFIHGFIKRASEYGFNHNEAMSLLKKADQLMDLPLSSMTPKTEWEAQLHDILAKRPMYEKDTSDAHNDVMRSFSLTQTFGDGIRHAYAPTALQKKIEENDELWYDPLTTKDSRSWPTVEAVANHIKKYNPAWGGYFRKIGRAHV